MIEYSEYKNLIDILDNSENVNSTAYEDLMKKEQNVLSTVNHVVKHIQDKKEDQFMNMRLEHIIQDFFMVWPKIVSDLTHVKSISEMYDVFTKENRIIYCGIMLIIVSIIMHLFQTTNIDNKINGK